MKGVVRIMNLEDMKALDICANCSWWYQVWQNMGICLHSNEEHNQHVIMLRHPMCEHADTDLGIDEAKRRCEELNLEKL